MRKCSVKTDIYFLKPTAAISTKVEISTKIKNTTQTTMWQSNTEKTILIVTTTSHRIEIVKKKEILID